MGVVLTKLSPTAINHIDIAKYIKREGWWKAELRYKSVGESEEIYDTAIEFLASNCPESHLGEMPNTTTIVLVHLRIARRVWKQLTPNSRK